MQLGANQADNIHCWCAMVAPYSSKWGYRYQYNDAAACAKNCARGCRNAMIFDGVGDPEFRQIMYTSILGE